MGPNLGIAILIRLKAVLSLYQLHGRPFLSLLSLVTFLKY